MSTITNTATCPICAGAMIDYSRSLDSLRARYAQAQAGQAEVRPADAIVWHCPDCESHFTPSELARAEADRYYGLREGYLESIRRKRGTVGGADPTGRAKAMPSKRKAQPGDSVFSIHPDRLATKRAEQYDAALCFHLPAPLAAQLRAIARAVGLSLTELLRDELRSIYSGGLDKLKEIHIMGASQAVPRGRPRKVS